MVVSVARIAMLAVRLATFLSKPLFAGLRVDMSWSEAGNKESGKQEAKHTHGSSPFAGRHGPKPGPT
jgi:hypothetical protein